MFYRESQAELEHHTNSVLWTVSEKTHLAKVKQPELPKPSPAPVAAHESDEESLGVFKSLEVYKCTTYLAFAILPQPLGPPKQSPERPIFLSPNTEVLAVFHNAQTLEI